MLGIVTVILTTFFPTDLGPTVSPSAFQEHFERATVRRATPPPSVSREASKYRYVFVGGFLNERMPGYFAINAKELHAMGVSRRSVHAILPSSHETIEGNAGEVRARFEEIAGSGNEKLVIIAHSRGACDVLAFALRNPGFVRDQVAAIFLLQGPFGGTRVAEYVSGKGGVLDPAIPWGSRAVLSVIGRLEAYFLGKGQHGGLSGMTPDASKEYWAALLRERRDAITIVGPKTFYVVAAIDPSRLRFIQRATGWYLQLQEGANDGVVAISDQSLHGVGTIVAALEAGHNDFTHGRTSCRETREFPRALTTAIVASLADDSDPFAIKTPTGRRVVQKFRRTRASSSPR